MVQVSQFDDTKENNQESEFTQEELEYFRPLIQEFTDYAFKKGKAEGIEKGIEKMQLDYIIENPIESDKEIAAMLNIKTVSVKRLRRIANDPNHKEKGSLLHKIPEFSAKHFIKGRELGIVEGIEKVRKIIGRKEILLLYMAKNPMLSDEHIGRIFSIKTSFVEQLRKEVK
ncbi:MAG: hypothetical protein RIR11_3120 [Bacteroidota bacterium]